MSDIDKWLNHGELKPEEEPEYLKDLCEALRKQETLSEPVKKENGHMECDIIKDDFAAHVADVIEELWNRVQKLEYELRECKAQ